MSAFVEITGLHKRFGDTIAVQSLDLTLNVGEIVGLLGPSGCGKTTTLRCLAGLEEPSAGTITIRGSVVDSPGRHTAAERRGIGMVFQSYALWPNMTVHENIRFVLQYSNISRDEYMTRSNDVLVALGLRHLADRYPSQLSGGQQQRVAVARAIAHEPDLLLFDEPLSNLDAKLRREVRLDLKLLLRRLGTTALYVTHDQEEAMAMCDRIVVMSNGEIRQSSTSKEVYERPTDLFVASFIGSINVVNYQLVRGEDDNLLRLNDWEVRIPLADVPVTAPASGLIGWRPERLILSAEGGGNGNMEWEGQVLERLYLGSHFEYLVTISCLGTKFTVNSSEVALDVGSVCYVSPEIEASVWIPEQDEERRREPNDIDRQVDPEFSNN